MKTHIANNMENDFENMCLVKAIYSNKYKLIKYECGLLYILWR